MTWNARDAMPAPKRDRVATAPTPKEGAGKKDTPEKIPTYAQRQQSLLADEEEGAFRLTQAQERELMGEGIWPEREWSIWKHAVQRGVQAY